MKKLCESSNPIVTPITKKWLSTQEAMEYCCCKKDYFREKIKKSNEVVRSRKGRKDFYLLESLNDWIAHNIVVTPEDAVEWRKLNERSL